MNRYVNPAISLVAFALCVVTTAFTNWPLIVPVVFGVTGVVFGVRAVKALKSQPTTPPPPAPPAS